MTRKLKIYLTVIISCGFIFITYSFYNLIINQSIDQIGFLLFIILSMLSELLAVNMKYGSISVGFAINLASILLFGPFAGAIIALLGPVLRMRDGSLLNWYKILFNMAAMALTTGISGLVYQVAGGTFGLINISNNIIPLVYAVITYLFVNNLTMAAVISLAQNIDIWKVWKSNLKWTVPNYLALAILGVLISAIYLELGVIAILLFFIPLTLARQSFKMYQNIKEVHLTTVQALISTIEAKDAYTKGHSERVSDLSVKIARSLNYSEKEIEKIKYAGLLHDVGKVSLKNNILNKPGRLNKKEYEIVKEHPEIGAKIIENVKYLSEVADYVRYHHERLDGSGYPEGLKGEEIPEGARILAVADVYDALTSDRPYRNAWNRNRAIKLFANDDECFDQKIVQKLLKIVRERKKVS